MTVRAPVARVAEPVAPQTVSAVGSQGVGRPAYLERLRRPPVDFSKAIAVTAVCGSIALVGLIGLAVAVFQGPRAMQALADARQQQSRMLSKAGGALPAAGLTDRSEGPEASALVAQEPFDAEWNAVAETSYADHYGSGYQAPEQSEEDAETASGYGAEHSGVYEEYESAMYGATGGYGSDYGVAKEDREADRARGYGGSGLGMESPPGVNIATGGSDRSGPQPGGQAITVEATLVQPEESAEQKASRIERDKHKIFAEYQEKVAEVESIFPERFQLPVADSQIQAEFVKIRERQIWLSKQRVARQHRLSESEMDAIVAEGSTSRW